MRVRILTLLLALMLSAASGQAEPISPQVHRQQQERLAQLQHALGQTSDATEKLALSQKAMSQEEDSDARRQLVEIMRKAGGHEWEPFLIGVAQRDPDAGLRGLAASLLGQTGTGRAFDVLAQMAKTDLRTPRRVGCIGFESTARREAMFALAELAQRVPELKDNAVAELQRLSDLPQDDESLSDVRLQSLYQITHDDKLIDPFIQRLRSDDPKQRVRGVVALRFLKLRNAPALLVPLLKDRDTDVRSWAALVLGEIGDPGTVPSLMTVAEDPHAGDARVNAVQSLGLMKSADAVPLLERLLHDPDPRIPANAAVAIYRITGKKVSQFPTGYNAE